jgi:hypothetical protein
VQAYRGFESLPLRHTFAKSEKPNKDGHFLRYRIRLVWHHGSIGPATIENGSITTMQSFLLAIAIAPVRALKRGSRSPWRYPFCLVPLMLSGAGNIINGLIGKMEGR